MKAHRLFAYSIASLLLAASSSVLADPTNAPAQESRPAHVLRPNGLTVGQTPGMGGYAGGPVSVLTDQQRASYDMAMNGERDKLGELQSKVRAARQDLLTTSVTGKFDENLVRQKALAVARIEAEMTVLRMKAFSQVQPPLTPEQIEKIKSSEMGPFRPLARQQLERSAHRDTAGGTNQDENGLPPKH